MHVPLKYFFETLVNTSYPSLLQRFPGQRHIRSSKADYFHSKNSPLFGFSHDLEEAKVQMKTQFVVLMLYYSSKNANIQKFRGYRRFF